MEKQISFSGVALTPYNDISPDGQLSACVNLEHHAGSLRPSELGGTPITVFDIANLIFIHATSEYRHMIFYDGSVLSWAEEAETIESLNVFSENVMNVKSVTAIGNTLVVNSSEKMNYYLFIDGSYKELGVMPEPYAIFGLQNKMLYERAIPVVLEEPVPLGEIYSKPLSQANKDAIMNKIRPYIVQYIDKTKDEGLISYPFFARVAFRLYDGSFTKPGPPVLMVPASGANPLVFCQQPIADQYGKVNSLVFYVIVSGGALVLTSGYDYIKISGWEDIIKSLCIFASQPVSTIYPDFTDIELTDDMADDSFSIGKFINANNAGDRNLYQKVSLRYMGEHLDSINFLFNGHLKLLPEKPKLSINEEIREVSNFYLLCEYYLSKEFNIKRGLVSVEASVLKNLTLQERLVYDFRSHDLLSAEQTFSYNSRLILAGVKRHLFEGFQPNNLFCMREDGGTLTVGCYVFIKENGKEYIVYSDNNNSTMMNYGEFLYFFYPNPNAYKAIVVAASSKAFELELLVHPFLNGAYYFSEFGTNNSISYELPDVTPPDELFVKEANFIYTSEVNNPFVFPAKGVNTVGTSEILGISSITTALSQGQFGSFPLMAFCTDGNYALQVDSEGLFSAVTPMQRDVCTNPKSITQIDGAIIFVTARGVMVADGSSIQPLSNILDGAQSDISQIAADDGLSEDMAVGIPVLPPVDFFQTCIIAYDYPNKRLLFMTESREDKAFGWQYSIDEQAWQQINFGNAFGTVNVFPSSYVQHTRYIGSSIKRLDRPYDYDASRNNEGYILTRPLKLDSLQYKSLRQVVLVGSFSRPQTVGIYGSNDGISWFRLGKSNAGRILIPGRYFKYYRFSVQTDLDSSENITGLRIEYDVRPERRLR